MPDAPGAVGAGWQPEGAGLQRRLAEIPPRVPARLPATSQPARKPLQYAPWKQSWLRGKCFLVISLPWLFLLKAYLHTNGHLPPWLIIHPSPISHVWSPGWPWAPDVTADDSTVSWKLHGGRRFGRRGCPWALPIAQGGSARLRDQQLRGTGSLVPASHPGPGRGPAHVSPAALPSGCPLSSSLAAGARSGQHRAEVCGSASPGCSRLGPAQPLPPSCWRQEPPGQREGTPSACSTGPRAHGQGGVEGGSSPSAADGGSKARGKARLPQPPAVSQPSFPPTWTLCLKPTWERKVLAPSPLRKPEGKSRCSA